MFGSAPGGQGIGTVLLRQSQQIGNTEDKNSKQKP